ncbi:MAG: phosphopyruvate hydratase [Candidatus Nomurabacteria bacterium]|jgi:enolase|nr:phosphopyruvate hydratase [Candidatus Nomurabacteria bacterium]
MNIKQIQGRAIFDSRGNPTVECDVLLSDGSFGRSSVPSGASTGSYEAVELRDGGAAFGGKGVQRAVQNINQTIAPVLAGQDTGDQRAIDDAMLALDGTENKSNLGANAILAVSQAVLKAAARSRGQILWQHIAELSQTSEPNLPLPMVNVINGGAHANFSTDIQEYMILPIGGETMARRLAIAAEIFHKLGEILRDEGYATTVGDEGGYAPAVRNGNIEPLFLIAKAVQLAGYTLGRDVSIALDVAASEFYNDGWYELKRDQRRLSNGEMAAWYGELAHQFPIVSIEDGLGEDDWTGWTDMMGKLGGSLQLVGDDLLVTNTKLLQRAIDEKACNAILIKPNQIGTVSETIDAVKLAKQNGFNTIISHRSGETEDPFIAHLAVGVGAGQIKTGSMSRGERLAKYNELLRIAEQDAGLPSAR